LKILSKKIKKNLENRNILLIFASSKTTINMDVRLNIISFLKENTNKSFSYKEIHTISGGEYKETYNVLQRLVREKIVNKVWPGLCGGRNCEYYVK